MATSWDNVREASVQKTAKPNSYPGVVQPFWVWASAVPVTGIPRKKISKAAESAGRGLDAASSSVEAPVAGPDAELNDLLTQNPSVTGAVFLNLLKSKGFRVVKGELDGSSSAAGVGDSKTAQQNAKDIPAEKQGASHPSTVAASPKNGDASPGEENSKGEGKNGDDKKKKKSSGKAMGAAADKKAGATPGAGTGKPVEADAGGSFPQAVRANEAWLFRSRFIESAASDNGIGPTRFRVVLLEEGLGNFRDGYFYSKEALKSAVTVFEGKKIFADHPDANEDKARPERSVRDVLGYFEKCGYQESDDGQGQLVADVVTMADKPYEWARALMREAVEFSKKHPDKEFIGLSINANGAAEARPIEDVIKETSAQPILLKLNDAMERGLTEVKVVRQITEAVSCDLVTEAGAGGKVLQILESEKGGSVKQGLEEYSPDQDRADDGQWSGGGGSSGGSGSSDASRKGKSDSRVAKSNASHIAFRKKSDAIKSGISKVKTQKMQHDQIKKTTQDRAKSRADAMRAKFGTESNKGEVMENQDGAEHKDQAQDAELIKSMLDKYLGQEEHPEELMTQAKEAHQAAMESGLKSEEASEMVGQSLKCARIMNKKEAATQEAVGEKKPEGEEKKEETKESQEAAPKESAELLRLKGENASLKETIAKGELEKHIDEALQKSGLPRTLTKSLREAKYRGKEDFDRAYSLFNEGYKGGRGETDDLAWVGHEKVPAVQGGQALDLSDCVTE